MHHETFCHLNANVYWEVMEKDVADFIQLSKYANNTYLMLHLAFCNQYLRQLQSRTTLHWNLWSTSLYHGITVIMLAIDHFTKTAQFVYNLPIFLRTKVTKLFTNMIGKLYGYPRASFPTEIRYFFSRHYFNYGTKLRMIMAYNPPTDGQTEVLNRVFNNTYELLLM